MALPFSPDIDRILEAIRAEARARGSRAGGAADAPASSPVHVATHGLPQPQPQHVADFMALPLDVFLALAYRQLLGREPDAAGATHYQRALLRGSLTRAEVLGRLAYSPEGRRRRSALAGLPAAFVLAMIYRIPIAGPAAALLARALRLPAHWQDRSAIEAAALAGGSWMKR